jgi:hypothetical protein
MEQELAEAKEEKRLAEFAQARAEQLAIARGEALYKCQERLTEAERQQVQLADVLKLTLDKLGMGLTPSPLPQSEYERSPGQLPDRPAGPLFASANGLAVDTDLASVDHQKQQHHSSSASEPDTPLSGFTVYSNELHDSPGAAGRDSRARSPTYYTNIDNERQQRRQYLESLRPSSATKWKDISEVAAPGNNRSSSPDCATPLGAAPLTAPLNGTLATTAAGVDADAEADRLAKLIIPHLQASQLESLVRFGASLGSPTLASPQMQRHLVAALRKSRNEEGFNEDQQQQQQRRMNYQQPDIAPPRPSIAQAPRAPEEHIAPAMPAPVVLPPRPLMQQQQQQHYPGNVAGGGPLSQAAAWASPGLNGSSAHHIKTVFENATQLQGGAGGGGNSGGNGENGCYRPFSAAATTASENANNNQARSDALAMPPPPPLPKKTTFKIVGSAAPPRQEQQHYSTATAAIDSSLATSDGSTIKAVMQQNQYNSSVNDDDRFARQRRVAERLAAKINSKLPPEYRTADPLGLSTDNINTNNTSKNVVQSRAISASTSTSSGGSGNGGKRAPKGSLRRQQAEAYRWGD